MTTQKLPINENPRLRRVPKPEAHKTTEKHTAGLLLAQTIALFNDQIWIMAQLAER